MSKRRRKNKASYSLNLTRTELNFVYKHKAEIQAAVAANVNATNAINRAKGTPEVHPNWKQQFILAKRQRMALAKKKGHHMTELEALQHTFASNSFSTHAARTEEFYNAIGNALSTKKSLIKGRLTMKSNQRLILSEADEDKYNEYVSKKRREYEKKKAAMLKKNPNAKVKEFNIPGAVSVRDYKNWKRTSVSNGTKYEYDIDDYNTIAIVLKDPSLGLAGGYWLYVNGELIDSFSPQDNAYEH